MTTRITNSHRVELGRNKSVLKRVSQYLEEHLHEDLLSLKTKYLTRLFSICVCTAWPEFSALQKFLLFGIKEVWILYFATLVSLVLLVHLLCLELALHLTEASSLTLKKTSSRKRGFGDVT